MKDLLTKRHYCYKVHTSLMTSSAYAPSVDNPLYGLPPPPSYPLPPPNSFSTPYCDLNFLTAIWLSHDHPWPVSRG